MIAGLTEILEDAKRNRRAAGAFNTVSLESIDAVISAAEQKNVPVIIQHAQLHEPVIPLDVIGPCMTAAAALAAVPVCVHLDHGSDLDYLKRALELGFTSVMYDGSDLGYETNVANTQACVEMARGCGADVEAELGRVLRPDAGSDSENDEKSFYTRPDEARDFVQRTGIDALAAAFGTAHGIYKTQPHLDFERITQICEATGVPLVMHGGSGVSDDGFRAAIAAGVRKINYFTYMSLAGTDAAREYLDANPGQIGYENVSAAVRDGMFRHVLHALDVFSGKTV